MTWSKESRHSRGYGRHWEALRKQVLDAEPLCRACQAKGRVTLAREVDHIKPKAKGGDDDLGNLQPLCRPCHRAKSDADAGRRPQVRIGIDGWPVE